jgi:ferredoxin
MEEPTIMAVSQPVLLVTVDRSKCCGYTLCATEGPEVYSIDDAGYAVALDGVPAELEAQACRGAEACPDGAITVERMTGDE